MKNQQVVVDYSSMLKTSFTFLCLVFAGWTLLKLLQAVFWLPGYLEQNQNKLYKHIETQLENSAKINNNNEEDESTAVEEETAADEDIKKVK